MMADKKLRIAYMGTPDFAVPALRALINSDHKVVAVYSQPPRPKGRGHKMQPSPVHALAEEHNIPVYTPVSLKKDKGAQEEFAALDPDIAIVAAYGLILPKEVLLAPEYGCLNIHASLLPRWRGASPIQHAIWKGDAQTGVTIMQMEEGLDTGPMILKCSVDIGSDMYAQDLHDELSELGASMVEEVLATLVSEGGLQSEIQDDALSCYAPLLRKEDGIIDWNNSAEEICRQIRALNPWPGVKAGIDGKIIKIIRAAATAELSEKIPGTLIDKSGMVACGDGHCLKLEVVQPENSKKMDVVSAINGGHLSPGTKLG
jgi:methionyl-tRNA formyltransferase